jgi:hypothetical protein
MILTVCNSSNDYSIAKDQDYIKENQYWNYAICVLRHIFLISVIPITKIRNYFNKISAQVPLEKPQPPEVVSWNAHVRQIKSTAITRTRTIRTLNAAAGAKGIYFRFLFGTGFLNSTLLTPGTGSLVVSTGPCRRSSREECEPVGDAAS